MAKKRMFSLDIVDTDAFLDMPASARLLYYDLCMRADDEGFIGNAKTIMRISGASTDDLKILTAKCFVISFEQGIVVIKHWLIHNTIRTDRFKSTNYTELKEQLFTKTNKSYTLNSGNEDTLLDVGIPNGNQMATQYSTVEYSIDKSSIDTFFEECWTLYPNKKGKGQIKPKRKKIAYDKKDEFIRCIERYKADTKDTAREYLQHGSTFWNGGYVDYLDDNYEKPTTTTDISSLILRHPTYADMKKANPKTTVTAEMWYKIGGS